MSDPSLDTILREYLDEKRIERDRGYTLANLQLTLNQFGIRLTSIEGEIGALKANQFAMSSRQDRHGRDIRAMKKQLSFADAEVDTGVHQLEDVRRALAERKEKEEREEARRHESMIWWKRNRWAAVIGIVCSVIAASVTACSGYIAAKLFLTPPNVEKEKKP